MQSTYWRQADHKQSLLCFLLIICAFLLAEAKKSNAQWLAPSVKDLVEHKGFTWKSTDTTNFRLYFESGTFGEKHIDKLKESAEQARQRVLTLLGEPAYQDRVTIFILDSRARMKTLLGKELNGIAFPNRNAILYVVNDTINASGAHELCHVLAKNLWGKTDDWINEGLAVYSDDIWYQYQLHELAKHLLLRQKLIPLAEVVKHPDKHSDLVTYPELGSFVKFLYEKYGMKKVKELWQKDVADIGRITGKNLNELEKEWHEVIGQADASKVNYPTIGVKRWDR